VTDQLQRLGIEQIETYEALTEFSALLRFKLEAQLREESEITFVQFHILGKLMRAPKYQMRMTDLAEGIVLSKSGLTYQVGLLVDLSLVTRFTDSEDERSTVVELTHEGLSLFQSLLPGHVEIVQHLLFDGLSEGEEQQLSASLKKLRDRLR
jgi:DNA-binding MarR family transcriptional regulator